MTIAELAAKYEQYVIDMRREFHENPELSHHEECTVRRIREELDKLGIPNITVGHNNVIGTLEAASPARRSPSVRTSMPCRWQRPTRSPTRARWRASCTPADTMVMLPCCWVLPMCSVRSGISSAALSTSASRWRGDRRGRG